MKSKITNTMKVVLLGMALVSLQACATGGSSNNTLGAYDTAGVVPAKPYTRTIFSTHDF